MPLPAGFTLDQPVSSPSSSSSAAPPQAQQSQVNSNPGVKLPAGFTLDQSPAGPAESQQPEQHGVLDDAGNTIGQFIEASPIGQIANTASNLIQHPIDTVTNTVKGISQQLGNAVHDLNPNDPNNVIVRNTDKNGVNLAQAFSDVVGDIPLIGPAIVDAGNTLGEAMASGDPYQISGAVGKSAGVVLSSLFALRPGEAMADTAAAGKAAASGAKTSGEFALKQAKAVTEKSIDMTTAKVSPETMVMGGLRGSVPSGRVDFGENLRDYAMPAIRDAAESTGRHVDGLDSLITTDKKPGLINVAKRQIQSHIDTVEGPRKAMGMQLDGSEIADALRDTITHKMRIEDPAKVQQVLKTADSYAKQKFSIDQAYDILGDTNDELESYYAKSPAARKIQASNNPEIAGQVAIGNKLRNQLYQWENDPAAGESLRTLRKQYGSLTEFDSALYRRRNVMLRQAPMNLVSQMGKVGGLYSVAKGGMKVLGGLTGRPGLAVSGLSDVAAGASALTISKWLQDYISTDSLINRAFRKTIKPSPEIHFPEEFKPAGLLEKGSTQMPAGPDTSGPVARPVNQSPHVGNRLLHGATQVQQPGFAVDTVPVKNPVTGEIEYVPEHWKGALSGKR